MHRKTQARIRVEKRKLFNENMKNDKGYLYVLKLDIFLENADNHLFCHILAILRLSEPITLDHANKGTVCLPDNQNPVLPGTICDMVGWGHSSAGGDQTETLHHVQLPVVHMTVCNASEAYNGTMLESSLCAGLAEGGKDACNYDGGGALACERGGRYYAEGMSSSGFECAQPHAYGIYTDVAKMTAWVVETILSIDDSKGLFHIICLLKLFDNVTGASRPLILLKSAKIEAEIIFQNQPITKIQTIFFKTQHAYSGITGRLKEDLIRS